MKENITVDLNEVSNALNRIRARPASETFTSEVIREYMGGFLSNKGVPVHLSWNAQFGRILSKNAEALGIKELKPDQRVSDDLGRETTSSLWAV